MKQTSELRHFTIKLRLKIYTNTDRVTILRQSGRESHSSFGEASPTPMTTLGFKRRYIFSASADRLFMWLTWVVKEHIFRKTYFGFELVYLAQFILYLAPVPGPAGTGKTGWTGAAACLALLCVHCCLRLLTIPSFVLQPSLFAFSSFF